MSRRQPVTLPAPLRARAVNVPADEEAPTTASTDDTAPPPADEAIKRLTLDLPRALHAQLKIRAASEGVTMASLVRAWIGEKVG